MGDCNRYTPELGQAVFGQPSQALVPDEPTESAIQGLAGIWDALCHDKPSPFGNTGARFDGKFVNVHAYSWNDDEEQPWNLKWRDLEMSWYKYHGRGVYVNRQLGHDEIIQMVKDFISDISIQP